MISHLANHQQIRVFLLAVLFASLFATQMRSQSNIGSAIPDSAPSVNRSPHESTPQTANVATGDPSSTSSPEEVRQLQIEAETKKLYQLSAELRAEVAKTYRESLSLTVLKKAEEVERLAKSLRMLMSRNAASTH